MSAISQMKYTFILTFIASVTVGNVVAQTETETLKSQVQARWESLSAVKKGNVNSVIPLLRSRVKKGPHEAAEDVQVVSELCALANLEARTDGVASETTVNAIISEASNAKRKVSQIDAAYIDSQIGELLERTVGNLILAKQYYQAALARNSACQDAVNGLQRIRALEELVAAKERENSQLRSSGK